MGAEKQKIISSMGSMGNFSRGKRMCVMRGFYSGYHGAAVWGGGVFQFLLLRFSTRPFFGDGF
jgi:hypothetical protein